MSAAVNIDAILELRRQFWAHGYRPLEVYSHNKRPFGLNWTERARRTPPEAVTVKPRWEALSTGILSYEVIGVDADVLNPELVTLIERLAEEALGITPLRRIGQPPKLLLVYRAEEPFQKIKTPELFLPDGSKCQVEILADGQQFVADGIHPDTQQPYRWTNYKPQQIPVSSLPTVTEDQCRRFVAAAEQVLLEFGAKPKERDEPPEPEPKPHPHQSDSSGRFFHRVNEAALGNIGAWVRKLFPRARFEPGNGAWRVSSKDLGRNLQEDISVHPSGIQDFGEERTYTAIDLVVQWNGNVKTPLDAALWLCDAIGCDPTSLGYTKPRGGNGYARGNRSEQPHTSPHAGIPLKTGKDFTLQKVDWFWRGWIARGKFHLLAGQKTAGKSTISFDLMANVSSANGKWPDGSPAPHGDVLIWSGEDCIEDTILPRFVAAGGDLGRIYPVRDITLSTGETRPFDSSTDIQALIDMAEKIPNLLLVVIDPVVLALPDKLDSHKNTETRRGLQPLVDFAERRNVALIGITHFTKGTGDRDPIERVTGSLAFGALPRVVLGASADADGFQRRLVRIASNIGPTGGGIEYTLHEEPLIDYEGLAAQRISWGAKLTGSPAELLNAKKQSAQSEATAFLRDFLSCGSKPQKEVKEAAVAHGHSWGTIRLAQKSLGIKPKQVGRGWNWELPKVVSTWPTD